MFEKPKKNEESEPILRPVNKYLRRLEFLKTRYYLLILLLLFTIIALMPSPINEQEFAGELDGLLYTLASLILVVYISFGLFVMGFKKGVNAYKPQKTYLTPKMLKKMNKKFANLKDGETMNVAFSMQDDGGIKEAKHS